MVMMQQRSEIVRIAPVGLMLLFLLGSSGWGCDGESRGELEGDPVLEVSVGPLAPRGALQGGRLREGDGIIDGDTVRVVGFDQSIRLLCLDTEEALKGEELAEA